MEPVAEPALRFAELLRLLRTEARLTQEELAEAAGVSPRSVSNLERGINRTAHKDTAQLLAGALNLAGPVTDRGRAGGPGRDTAGGVHRSGDPGAATRYRRIHRPLRHCRSTPQWLT